MPSSSIDSAFEEVGVDSVTRISGDEKAVVYPRSLSRLWVHGYGRLAMPPAINGRRYFDQMVKIPILAYAISNWRTTKERP